MSASGSPGGSDSSRSDPENKIILNPASPPEDAAQSTMTPNDVYQLAAVSSVTAPGISVAPPTAPAPPQPAPRSWLMRLPNELKMMIIDEFEPESRDVQNVASTIKEWRDMALARYWSAIERDQSITQLLTQRPNVQQTYANLIRKLRINGNSFRTNDFLHMRFNFLQELVIEQKGDHEGNTLQDISGCIGPRLESLRIAGSRDDENANHLKVANFFPILNRAPGLRVLDFGCDINAGPQDLLAALQSLPTLEEICFRWHSGRDSNRLKIDHEVLRYVARNRRLKIWSYPGRYDGELVRRALEGRPSDEGLFLGLSKLDIVTTDEAGRLLLPRLHSLKDLGLQPTDHGDVLQSVAKMRQLSTLRLYYVAYLTPITTQLLAPLQFMSLKDLTLPTGLRRQDGSTISMNDLSFMFGSHDTLESLMFNWDGTDMFRTQLGQVLHRLIQAYPNLKKLCLPFSSSLGMDDFDAYQLPHVSWPSLTSLRLREVRDAADPAFQ